MYSTYSVYDRDRYVVCTYVQRGYVCNVCTYSTYVRIVLCGNILIDTVRVWGAPSRSQSSLSSYSMRTVDINTPSNT